MSSPVSNKPIITFDPGFEAIKDVMKKEGQASLEKTSEHIKIALKEQTDISVKSCVPIITSPVTYTVKTISPEPVANILNTSIETCAENTSNKMCHTAVDEWVDKTAKKAIDKTVDASVDSTQSYFTRTYNYIVSKWY